MPEENQKSPEQIVFVNDKPATCGCTKAFSDGGGQYSDVVTVTLCAVHSPTKPFGPAEVKRDEHGYWWHPDIPDFGEDTEAYIAWVQERNLALTGWHLGDELEPPLDENDEEDVTAWKPKSPGPEWFLMGIFESEDGACVQWAKRALQ